MSATLAGLSAGFAVQFTSCWVRDQARSVRLSDQGQGQGLGPSWAGLSGFFLLLSAFVLGQVRSDRQTRPGPGPRVRVRRSPVRVPSSSSPSGSGSSGRLPGCCPAVQTSRPVKLSDHQTVGPSGRRGQAGPGWPGCRTCPGLTDPSPCQAGSGQASRYQVQTSPG